ncbi:MAG: FtsW/RodA/SpoVE family cell cycle protein [Bacilli bacterium]|nr:FtsW/RodA/SpoVE family cell cycle protein [Bacilli bacterium]
MKRLLARMDKKLFFTTLVLFIIGLIMIFSASTIASFMRYNVSTHYFFMKQAISLVIGFIAFCIIINLPLKIYHKLIWPLVGILIIVLILLLAYGQAINKSVSWISIMGLFSIQPSEFAKIILILFMAIYYERNKKDLDKYQIVFTPPAITLLIVVLVLAQPDFGTAMIIATLVFLTFLVVPINNEIKRQIIKLIIGIIIVVAMVILVSGRTILSSTQHERLNFTKPCDRYETTGYHVCNGYISINNGGLLGVGLGNSTQKYSYLPYPHTDFIYAIVLEELGLIFGLLFLGLMIYAVYRIMLVAKSSYNITNFIIAYGVGIYILLHILINLTGILGLLPLTGIPLPFFSYGGSFALSLSIALGFVQRAHIENYNYRYKQKLKGKLKNI